MFWSVVILCMDMTNVNSRRVLFLLMIFHNIFSETLFESF